MKHNEIVKALETLKPGAHWTLTGHDLKDLIWHDDAATRPADQEIVEFVSAQKGALK